jgi:hypothetical protein
MNHPNQEDPMETYLYLYLPAVSGYRHFEEVAGQVCRNTNHTGHGP